MKNKNIQALRGICALMVFFSHSLHVYDSSVVTFLHNSVLHIFFDGEIAVCVFFVLSGYFYFKEDSFSFIKYKNAFLKKAKKIYPPHWVFLTIGFVISTLYQRYNLFNDIGSSEWFSCFWKKPVSFGELLRGYSVILKPDPHLINPPVWYLEAEVTMFFIMPLAVYYFNKFGWIFSFPLILLSTFYKIPLIPWFGAYLLGAIAKKYVKMILKVLDYNKFTIPFFVLIGLLLLNVENELFVHNSVTTMISCLGACILIVILFDKRVRLFECIVFQFMGDISYEFYLCHFIVLLALKPFVSNVLLYIIICIMTSIFLAFYVKRLLQRVIT